MFALQDLPHPLVVAPMAGGMSTPELVVAAERAGALGFLAAGYKSVEAMTEQIARTRQLGGELVGVNLFVPDPEPVDLAAARAYRERLTPLARRYGVQLPEPHADDDAYDVKIAALLENPVTVASFAFGCPSGEVVARLHEAGTAAVATVTSADEARQAAAAGVDALAVQGPGAGGHRATFDARAVPPEQPLPELLTAVRSVTDLPLVAAGGICTPAAVRETLELADAVQLGTAFLDADEAGSLPTYRTALRDPDYTQTVLTRAFSGRYARGLRNAFIDEFGESAPAAYPAVNQLTGPLRRAAGMAGDAAHLSLWAGTGWRDVPTGSTAAIIEALLAEVPDR